MEVETHLFPARDDIPNSSLPLLVLREAVGAEDATASVMTERFREHGWQGCWTYTVFDYWHYHADGHEVLGCVGGEAEIGFGGPGGITTRKIGRASCRERV